MLTDPAPSLSMETISLNQAIELRIEPSPFLALQASTFRAPGFAVEQSAADLRCNRSL